MELTVRQMLTMRSIWNNRNSVRLRESPNFGRTNYEILLTIPTTN